MSTLLRVLAAAALFVAQGLGQGSVLLVDSAAGPYTSIQAAIDAANDGDTILVKAGSYQGFTVNAKGLTITADLGHVVNVSGTILVANLGASQDVVLRALKITVLFVPGVATPPPTFINNAGAVWVEDCIIIDSNLGISFSGFPGHGVHVENCASAVFARCSLTGSSGLPSGEGIHAVSSVVALHDCTLRGADAAISLVQPLAGGDGLTQSGGSTYASGTSFVAGKGSVGVVITVSGFPPVCHDGGPGGNGIVLSGLNPTAHLLGCTMTPGVGGVAQTQLGCVQGAPGQPTVVNAGSVTTLTGVARHYFATGPIRGGASTSLVFQAPFGEGVWLAYWTEPATVFVPLLQGPLLVGGPPALAPIGTMPGSGSLSVPVPLPDPTPGLIGMTFFTQAVFLAGSSAFLGPASELSLLNSGVP